jgi:hypothetical protein
MVLITQLVIGASGEGFSLFSETEFVNGEDNNS